MGKQMKSFYAGRLVEKLMGNFYGRLDELTEELEDAGYDILEANRESITFGYEDDDEDLMILLTLGGTESTIIIHDAEVIATVD